MELIEVTTPADADGDAVFANVASLVMPFFSPAMRPLAMTLIPFGGVFGFSLSASSYTQMQQTYIMTN